MIELSSGNLILRGFNDSDKRQLAKLCNNINIWNNLRDSLPYPYMEKNAIEFIQICQKEDPQTSFVIEYNGTLIGCIGLVRQTDIYKLTAEIGYWIGEPYWGNGYTTKAVSLIVEYGFSKLGLVRIYAGVFDFNEASQRVLEKAGFKLECIFEKSILKNDAICNEYRYCKIL